MMHPRRVLFATDFSPASERARDAACELAKAFDAEVIVLHVVEPHFHPYPVALPDSARRSAQNDLDHLEATFRCAGVRVRTAVRSGHAAEAIVAAANEDAIDILVLGTHGRRGLTHLLMGSVAERVVRSSVVPVMTVAPSGCEHFVSRPSREPSGISV
jgi:nucleotide-binding universal stress UspA family protein